MRAPSLAIRVTAGALVALGAVALGSACLNSVINNLENIPFDGGYLGACEGGTTRPIESGCPGACSNGALAICVGSSYQECSCLPSTVFACDSGCCAAPGYSVDYCRDAGKVAVLDPSEGLCDASNGYLLCNGTCFASFACDLPSGYRLLVDAGRDAASDAEAGAGEGGTPEGGSPEGGEAGPDASDAAPDVGDGGAPPPDAAKDAAKDGAKDGAKDAAPDAPKG